MQGFLYHIASCCIIIKPNLKTIFQILSRLCSSVVSEQYIFFNFLRDSAAKMQYFTENLAFVLSLSLSLSFSLALSLGLTLYSYCLYLNFRSTKTTDM